MKKYTCKQSFARTLSPYKLTAKHRVISILYFRTEITLHRADMYSFISQPQTSQPPSAFPSPPAADTSPAAMTQRQVVPRTPLHPMPRSPAITQSVRLTDSTDSPRPLPPLQSLHVLPRDHEQDSVSLVPASHPHSKPFPLCGHDATDSPPSAARPPSDRPCRT